MSEQQVETATPHTKEPALGGMIQPMDPTGSASLDRILGGGLRRGALTIIGGPPGSGKTTLAVQMAFAAARAGRRALVLTALSEPTDKLIAHLRSFSFYDDGFVGDAVQFVSLQAYLERGLEGAAEQTVAIARQMRASLVILDGFRGMRGAEPNPQAARIFLYTVGAMLNLLGMTTLVTSETDPRDPRYFPEATTADVILGLRFELEGVRQARGIEIIKARGAAPLPGLHGLALTSDGVQFYPRLETEVIRPAPDDAKAGDTDERAENGADAGAGGDASSRRDAPPAAFDLPTLDTLLGGGLTRGSSTLLLGSSGTGKTLLALHFALAGARVGEPTVYLSFRETREQLAAKAQAFASLRPFQQALASPDALALLRVAPVEPDPDEVAQRLLRAIDEIGARRLVVDSVDELESAVADQGEQRRVKPYIAALLEALRARNVTSLFIRETGLLGAQEARALTGVSGILAENAILLRQVEDQGRLRRVLAVLKMRFSAHDVSMREFVLSEREGIQVLTATESDAGALEERDAHEENGTASARADARPPTRVSARRSAQQPTHS